MTQNLNKKAMSIAWHEECLRHCMAHQAREEVLLEVQKDRVARRKEKVSFQIFQLQYAKDKGITAFDPDKFGQTAWKKLGEKI